MRGMTPEEACREISRRGQPVPSSCPYELGSLIAETLEGLLKPLPVDERRQRFQEGNQWLQDAFFALRPSRRPRNELEMLDLYSFISACAMDHQVADVGAFSLDGHEDVDGRYERAAKERHLRLGLFVAEDWWFGAGMKAARRRHDLLADERYSP